MSPLSSSSPSSSSSSSFSSSSSSCLHSPYPLLDMHEAGTGQVRSLALYGRRWPCEGPGKGLLRPHQDAHQASLGSVRRRAGRWRGEAMGCILQVHGFCFFFGVCVSFLFINGNICGFYHLLVYLYIYFALNYFVCLFVCGWILCIYCFSFSFVFGFVIIVFCILYSFHMIVFFCIFPVYYLSFINWIYWVWFIYILLYQ